MRNNQKIRFARQPSVLSSRSKEGFALIEIVVMIVILAIIGGIGLLLSMDQYRSYVLNSDRNTLVSMMQKARNKSMNNVNEAPHGVSIRPTSFVLFRGSSYVSRNPALDETVPRSTALTITGSAEVVFEQLTGSVTGLTGDITISNGLNSHVISINSEGRLNW